MILFRSLILSLLGLLAGSSPGAQTIRGTVEDSAGMPLLDVRVSLLDATNDTVYRTVRTGNAGDFTVTIGRAAKYRVRLNRIGYAQLTSGVIDVGFAQVVTLRFKMAVAAQTLAPIEVIERRKVTLAELNSSAGFDLRQSKYPMNTMDAERLAREGYVDTGELFRARLFIGVEVVEDSTGASLRMQQVGSRVPTVGGGVRQYCFPEVYLDGRLLSSGEGEFAPSSAAMALSMLSAYQANKLWGVEVYRGFQVPPPSIGGIFGSGSIALTRPCGIVAVWTKAGRERQLIADRAKALGSVQVVRGVVIHFDTGKPVPFATLTLKSESGHVVEPPVIADSTGTFSVQTKQYASMRITAGAPSHRTMTTPTFNVELEDLLTLEVIISVRHEPIAPIALVSRELPQSYIASDIRGFSYRRRRGVAGTFFDAAEIARRGAKSLADLVQGIPVVVRASAGPDGDAIAFTKVSETGQSSPCAPMYFLNGALEREADAKIRPLALSSLHGVELYPLATDVPFTYRMGSTGCGVLAVWTKPPPK